MSPKSSSLAFDDVKESQDNLDVGMVVQPKLNLHVKSALRNSILNGLSQLETVATVEGRITVSF